MDWDDRFRESESFCCRYWAAAHSRGYSFHPGYQGILHAGPRKAALSKRGERKGLAQTGWGEEEGKEEKGHVLVIGKALLAVGEENCIHSPPQSSIHPWRGQTGAHLVS